MPLSAQDLVSSVQTCFHSVLNLIRKWRFKLASPLVEQAFLLFVPNEPGITALKPVASSVNFILKKAYSYLTNPLPSYKIHP